MQEAKRIKSVRIQTLLDNMENKQRLLAGEITSKTVGKKVKASGWCHEIRDLGGLKFFIVRDRSGKIQVTLPKKEVSKELFDKADEITKESVIEVQGKVKLAKQAPTGVEIIPDSLEIVSKAETPVPIDISGKITSDLSVRLDYRFLDVRNEKGIALFKIRARLYEAFVEFFKQAEFVNINTPKITSAGVESGAELFPVVYFNKEAFLSQSPQIYKQMFVAAGLEKVYEIAPVFRAEKSHTTRHLTEFTGVDFEMGFIKDENDVMDVIEDMFKFVLQKVKTECKEELKLLKVEAKVPKKIPRITMEEARELLKKKGKEIPKDEDFDAEGEKLLGEIIQKKYGEEFVFVTLYPWKKRPFYHMKPEGEKELTRSFDLIWKGVEIATGAQREHRYEVLKAQAKEKKIELDKMTDYANIFKYGCPPHGGVGLGLDRITQLLCDLENVKEAILLPRDPERLTP